MTDDLKRAMEALEENMREHAEQRVVAPVYNKCCRFTRNHGATILAALREREQAIEQAYWRGSSEALVDTPWGSVDGVHKAIEQARKDEREAMYDMVQREDSRSLTGVSAHDPLRRLMDAIRARH